MQYLEVLPGDEQKIVSIQKEADWHMFGSDIENACFTSECSLTPFKHCATFAQSARSSERTFVALQYDKLSDVKHYAGSLHLMRKPGIQGYFLYSLCVRSDLRGSSAAERGEVNKHRVGVHLLNMVKALNEPITLHALNVNASDYGFAPSAKVLDSRKKYVFCFYEKNGFYRLPSASPNPAYYVYHWRPKDTPCPPSENALA